MPVENPLFAQARINVLQAGDRIKQQIADDICGKEIFPSLAELLELNPQVLRNRAQRLNCAFLVSTGIGIIGVAFFEYGDRKDGYHVWENKDHVLRRMNLPPLWPDTAPLKVEITSSGGTVPKRSKYIDLVIEPLNEFLRVYKDHGDIFSQEGINRYHDDYGGGFVSRASFNNVRNWQQIVTDLKSQPTQ